MKPTKERTIDDVRKANAARAAKYRAHKKQARKLEGPELAAARAQLANAKDGNPTENTAAPGEKQPREQLDWTAAPNQRPTVLHTVPIEKSFSGLSPESFLAVPKAMPAPSDAPPDTPDGTAPPDPEPRAFVDSTPASGPTQEEREAAAQRFAAAVALLVTAGVKASRELVAASDLEEPWRSTLLTADASTLVGVVHASAHAVGLKYEFIARAATAVPYQDETIVGVAVASSLVAMLVRYKQKQELGPSKARPRAAVASSSPPPPDDKNDEPTRAVDNSPDRPRPATADDWGSLSGGDA